MSSVLIRPHHPFAAFLATLALACATAPVFAQQPTTRADTTPLRADYRDLAELLEKLPVVAPPAFDQDRALWLGALPLACLDRLQSRPGGRGAGRANANSGAGYFWVPTYSLVADHDRLRAFWGCNDWHSAVSSTWVTVRLLRTFPNSALRELAREKLNAHLGKSNLDGELAFYRATVAAINPIPSASQRGLFELPYGFAWLLELQAELRAWPDTQAQRWAANVAPLATWMADSLSVYFPKLVEPVRNATQANTAQSMTLVLDYADVVRDTDLRRAIVTAARKFYLADTTCATQSERVVANAGGRGGRGGRGGAPPPAGGGQEILSPCLAEAALMSRILEPRAYLAWLERFLPPLHSGRFAPLTEPVSLPLAAPAAPARGGGTDTSTSASAAATALANERARLAALSFARAQAMERIARALPAADPRVAAWHRLSAIQADRGFELMRDDSAGLSWVPAQALLYATVRKP